MNAVASIQQPSVANIDTEAALCAAMMVSNELIDPIADLVQAEDFSDEFFGHLFSVIVREHSLGRPANPVALKVYFEPESASILAQLTGGTGASVGVIGARDFARQIADLAKRRRLIEGLREVIAGAERAEVPVEQIADAADSALSGALEKAQTTSILTFAEAFDATMKEIEDEAAGRGPQAIQIVGLDDFNELTGGLYRGDLVYIGGRPSMGKTALALGISRGAAEAGNGAAVFSLEMKRSQLMMRAMADLSFESMHPTAFADVKRGRFDADQRRELFEARRRIEDWPLIITDPPSLNVGRIAMQIRRYKRRMAAAGQDLGLVIIDYLGLIKGQDRRAKRYEEIGDISRTLKAVAKECDVAMVVLAQLNRECEKREDKRPMLSDLRDAGDIEQDADHVMFVYRDEYYLERSEPDPSHKSRPDWEMSMNAARNRMEIISAKARNGRVGKRNCFFFGKYQAVRGSAFRQQECWL